MASKTQRLERFPELKRGGSCGDLMWVTSSLNTKGETFLQVPTVPGDPSSKDTHTYTHTHTDTHTDRNTHTDTHTQKDTHRYTHTETHRETQTHTQTQTHPDTHTQTHTHTHTQTSTHTETHRHRHTHTHTHTHTGLCLKHSPWILNAGAVPAKASPAPQGHSHHGWRRVWLTDGTRQGMPPVLTWKPKVQVDQRDLTSSSLELINSEDRSFPNPADDLIR